MSAFLRTITGKNKTGQILFGLLDITGIPPIHNIVRQAFKEKVPVKEIPLYVWEKLDKLRLSTSILAIALSIAKVKGYISEEAAIEFLKSLSLFLSVS